MRETLSILVYISDDGAERFLNSSEGRVFFEGLRKRAVRFSVYGPGSGSGKTICPFESRPVSKDDFDTVIEEALRHCDAVFVVSDSLEAASSVEGKEGCLAFLLTEGGTPGFEPGTYIEIGSLSSLSVYFENGVSHPLMKMLRAKPVEYKTAVKKRNAPIMRQIGLAGGIYIFGAGFNGGLVYEQCIKSNIPIFGFIDNDKKKQGSKFYDLPVFAVSDLDPSTDVIIIASGNYSYDIYQQLKQLHFDFIQNLSEFFFLQNCVSQPEIFFHDDLWQNRVLLHVLYLKLADKISRKVLETIIEYRQGFDISLPAKVCDKQNPQWFDADFFHSSKDHVFIDGGAFDGDTALRFISLNGASYIGVHLFEPDPDIAKKAAANLSGVPRVYMHNQGLSNRTDTLFFSQTGGMNGHLAESKGVAVQIVSADDVIRDTITFLKLDVEGSEEDALAGAACQIRNNVPVLAIAVYHKACDLWAVPRQILGINPDYNLYLRHYTHISHDTVLYCTPINGSMR